MREEYTPQDYKAFKQCWQARFDWTPSPYQFYQFTVWLGLYRLAALEQSVTHTARWLKRTSEQQQLTEDDVTRA